MRLIDGDELYKSLKGSIQSCCEWWKNSNGRDDGIRAEQSRVTFIEAALRVKHAPTLEAEPVRHGHWIIKDNIYPVCSECGELSDYECDGTHKQSLFCPNCGAKMDGGDSTA